MNTIKYPARKEKIRRTNRIMRGIFGNELFLVDPVLIKFLDLYENARVTQDDFFFYSI